MNDNDDFRTELDAKIAEASAALTTADGLYARVKSGEDRTNYLIAKNARQLASDALDFYTIARAQNGWTEKARKLYEAGGGSLFACREDIGELQKAVDIE